MEKTRWPQRSIYLSFLTRRGLLRGTRRPFTYVAATLQVFESCSSLAASHICWHSAMAAEERRRDLESAKKKKKTGQETKRAFYRDAQNKGGGETPRPYRRLTVIIYSVAEERRRGQNARGKKTRNDEILP